MTFGSPILLLALLAVPLAVAVYVALERRRGREAAAWAAPGLVPNLVASRPAWRRHLPLALFLAGLMLLLVGFARPKRTFTVEREGATVVLAVDVSRSMEANDVKPTRLAAARAAAGVLLDRLPKRYQVALVTFGDHASVPVPPTGDRMRVRSALARAHGGAGTALGSAIRRAVDVARRAAGGGPRVSRPPASVLLLSDGAQTSGGPTPEAAARRARRLGIPVSTVSLGTANGYVERRIQGGFKERIAVPPDSKALQVVARASGGRFFSVATAAGLRSVYEDLGSRLAHERRPREVTAVAAGAALVFLLAGAGLSGVWFRRVP